MSKILDGATFDKCRDCWRCDEWTDKKHGTCLLTTDDKKVKLDTIDKDCKLQNCEMVENSKDDTKTKNLTAMTIIHWDDKKGTISDTFYDVDKIIIIKKANK